MIVYKMFSYSYIYDVVKKSKIIFSVTALKILRTRIFFYNLNTRTFSILGDSAGSSNSVFNDEDI